MNDYTGKICPYCKTEFRPGDDIIVCSECDMPHHKDCWVENQGCTTFGCLGTIKAADNTASSVTTTQMNFEDSRSTTAPVNSGVVFCTQYDIAYMTSTATSAGVKITINKAYKSVIPKLGLVDSSKDTNPEFTCCFCEKAFSGKRNKHSAGATRPKTNDEGIPNYCCSNCFKKYVVPMIGYAYKLRFVRGLPGYEDVPRDEKEIFASIQKMSLREIKDTIKREDIAELVLPTLEMLAHAEENRSK